MVEHQQDGDERAALIAQGLLLPRTLLRTVLPVPVAGTVDLAAVLDEDRAD